MEDKELVDFIDIEDIPINYKFKGIQVQYNKLIYVGDFNKKIYVERGNEEIKWGNINIKIFDCINLTKKLNEISNKNFEILRLLLDDKLEIFYVFEPDFINYNVPITGKYKILINNRTIDIFSEPFDTQKMVESVIKILVKKDII